MVRRVTRAKRSMWIDCPMRPELGEAMTDDSLLS